MYISLRYPGRAQRASSVRVRYLQGSVPSRCRPQLLPRPTRVVLQLRAKTHGTPHTVCGMGQQRYPSVANDRIPASRPPTPGAAQATSGVDLGLGRFEQEGKPSRTEADDLSPPSPSLLVSYVKKTTLT